MNNPFLRSRDWYEDGRERLRSRVNGALISDEVVTGGRGEYVMGTPIRYERTQKIYDGSETWNYPTLILNQANCQNVAEALE